MPNGAASIERLFGAPGERTTGVVSMRRRAAGAHERLIRRAAEHAGDKDSRCRSLTVVRHYLDGPDPAKSKRRLLCHPLLIEGLHKLAPASGALQQWHDAVAPPGPNACRDEPGEAARHRLGGVALALLLRADPNWRGEITMSTDAFGRVCFPGSDWSVQISTNGGEKSNPSRFLSGSTVHLSLDAREARWRLGDRSGPEFLIMDRGDCMRAITDNDEHLELSRLCFPDSQLRVRLQYARPLGGTAVRYDPVGFLDFRAHAGLTGGLVECLLDAVQMNAPALHREFRTFIHTVRGFEVSESRQGMIESFSDPTLPGVMGVNICYAAEQGISIEPFFFTNLGHELGHTRHYLIDTVLYDAGEPLLRNAGDHTPVVPRYGRALAVRTVFQIPFVHLYEWALLMDFLDHDFRGLPWDVDGGWIEFGDDLAAEIEEAFGLIDDLAQPTPLGAEALSWFRTLHARAAARWEAMKVRKPDRCEVT